MILSLGLFFLCGSSLWSIEELEELCHYRFSMPPNVRVTSQTPALIMAEKSYKSIKGTPNLQWLFSCMENQNRTSQTSEILAKAKQNQESIHHYEKTQLSQGIEAMILGRTRFRKGRRIHSLEAYFATRNYEYHFYVLPLSNISIEKDKNLYSRLTQEIKTLLSTSKFSKEVEKTITESEFQGRLYTLLGLASFIGIALLFWIIRSFFYTNR